MSMQTINARNLVNNRIDSLKEYVDGMVNAGVRETIFYDLVYPSLLQTKNEHIMIRRAKAFGSLLDTVPCVVLPYELISGSIEGLWPLTKKQKSYNVIKEEAYNVLKEYLDKKQTCKDSRDNGDDDNSNKKQFLLKTKRPRRVLYKRLYYDGNIQYEELQQLIEDMHSEFKTADIEKREISRELEEHFQFDYGEKEREVLNLPWIALNHMDFNYKKIVQQGIPDIYRETQEKKRSTQSKPQKNFYNAVEICLEAVMRFFNRYADELEKTGEHINNYFSKERRPADNNYSKDPPIESNQGSVLMNDADLKRSMELKEMAKICRSLSKEKPSTFREALQLVWMIHVIGNMQAGSPVAKKGFGGNALSLARFDQYLYAFYENDIKNGTITREQAKELISCVWIKINEPEMRTVQSVCLGGQTDKGENAANELTELCLEVCGDLQLPYPNTAVRMFGKSPHWLLEKVLETIKTGCGHPMILNDEKWIPNLIDKGGYRIEDARDYYNMGCVEMMLQGKQPYWRLFGHVIFPEIVELVLRNGGETRSGQSGICTGKLSDFTTFDLFLSACLKQMRNYINQIKEKTFSNPIFKRVDHYDPFASAFIDDCMENGKDLFHGGSRYRGIKAIGGIGLGTFVDSLIVIKKAVYEERMVTLPELFDVLKNNFYNFSVFKDYVSKELPCYGNDINEVDQLAEEVFEYFTTIVHKPYKGEQFVVSVFSYIDHIKMGETVMATPNGRGDAAAVSETIGPSQGKDINGPTAMINSILKLDQSKITGASALNIKFSSSFLNTEKGTEGLKYLLRTYLRSGGVQIQVNQVSVEEMIDAQKHPEEHSDLIVRVAGYSEYFVELDKHLQDEIIRRTLHT